MKYVVLAADDEIELLDALELFFQKEGIQFLKASNGLDALELFSKHSPHLVLLDIMMPKLDGFQVLKKIRETSKIPAIMLTARFHDYDKILGLELGADDYITKPYNPMEVVARVKAQLRRNYDYISETPVPKKLEAFGIVLDEKSKSVEKNGQSITLTKTEYMLLELFMKKQGQILTKHQIFEHVWNEAYWGDDRTIMVHISNLRAKINDDSKNPKIIKTIKGLGYRFEKEK